MTDEQMVEIVAEKVMGWCVHAFPEASTQRSEWICSKCGMVSSCYPGENLIGASTNFNPLTNDTDCMAAWDKFTVWASMHPAIADRMREDACYMVCSFTGAARRKRMVECMAKAVSE